MKNSKAILSIPFILLILISIGNTEVTVSEIKFWAFLHLLLHSVAFLVNSDKIKYLYSPYVVIIAVFNLVTYGVSPLFVNHNEFQLGVLNPFALEISFYAFAVFYFILYQVESNNLKRFAKVIRIKRYDNNGVFSGTEIFNYNRAKNIFLFLYIIILFIPVPVNELKNIIVYYTCGLLLVGFYSGFNSIVSNFFLITILLVESYKGISQGLLSPLIYLSIFLVIVSIKTFKRNFWNTFFSSLFIFFIASFIIMFSKVKADYRNQSIESGYRDNIRVMYDLIFNNEEKARRSFVINEGQPGLLWRLSYPLSALSCVLEETPRNVPYWNGTSYYPLFTKFIPRFLWPGKPEENMGQTFGYTYKILSEDNRSTSMNAPILAEAYMNFSLVGIFGIIIIMAFIIGNIFFKDNLILAEGKEIPGLWNIMKILKIAYVTTIFCQWESNLSMMLGKLIVLYCIDLVLRKFIIGVKSSKVIKAAYS